MLWASNEALGMTGAVFYFLTGDLLTIVMPLAWALGTFVSLTPNRLATG